MPGQAPEHTALPFYQPIDPDRPVEAWRLDVPAKGACFVLENAAGEPVQLATTADLRALLTRRFGEGDDENDGPTRKIDYRAVVRGVRYQLVFSKFEANWLYLENAIRLFPDRYDRLIRTWRARWAHINPDTDYPRWTITDRPDIGTGVLLGPFATRAAAKRFTDTLDDLFDLCRYYDLLVQAPDAAACAYKQMGKCPAPCDGTVSMASYRQQVAAAVAFAAGERAAWIEQREQAMAAASAALEFEKAGRLKTTLGRAREIAPTAPGYAHAGALADLRCLVLAPGGGKRRTRAFTVTTAGIDFHGEMQPEPIERQTAWLVGRVMQDFAEPPPRPVGHDIDRVNLFAWQLLRADRDHCIYLTGDTGTDTAAVLEAIQSLHATPETEEPIESVESDGAAFNTPGDA